MMKFADVLIRDVGEFGLYQKILLLLLALPTVFCGWHVLSWTYTGSSIPFRCLVDDENETNLPFNGSLNFSLWLYNDNKNTIKHSCERLVNVTVIMIKENTLSYTPETVEPCLDGYKWDTSEIENTALKKWSMVCNKSWLKSFVQSTYFVGQFFGSFIFGIAADKIGRKNAFFIANVIQIVCGIVCAYIPYWPLFAILRFGQGFAHPGIFILAVVMAIEFVGSNYRLWPPIVAWIFFEIGEICLAALAYFIRDYELLQLVLSGPAILFIVYYWIIPESPRWLLSQKRVIEAEKILRKMAKVNKRIIQHDWVASINNDNSSCRSKDGFWSNLFNLLKTPNNRKRSLVCFFCWFVVGLSYYTLASRMNFLGGDRYVPLIASGFLSIAGILIVLFTLNLVGRKVHLFGGFLFASFCLFITLAIPSNSKINENVRMSLTCIGKMAVTGVFTVIYVITSELFPTVVRGTAVGAGSMLSRLGAGIASYIALWLADISSLAVVLIFGTTCLLASVLSLLLSETTGYPLLETLEDAENFGIGQPVLYVVWYKKHETKGAGSVDTELPNRSSEANGF